MQGVVFKDPKPAAGTYLGNLAPDADSFSFVQITDIHVSDTTGVTPERVQEDLAQILSGGHADAAFVVATGDLTNRTAPGELADGVQALAQVPLPVFPMPGNHDTMDGEEGDGYSGAFGPRWYSFDWGPVHFAVYDSIRDAKFRNEFEGRHWLIDDLRAQPEGKPIVFLTHYQLAGDFYELLMGYNVVASISGHWHSSRIFSDGRITHYNGPSLCFGGIDYSPRAYRVFSWDGGKLKCRTVALGRRASGALQGVAFRPADDPGVKAGDGRLTPAGEAWPQLGGNAERNGLRGGDTASLHGETPTSLHRVWTAQLPGGLNLASPVTADDRIYVGTLFEDAPGKGLVLCLDATSGKEVWRRGVGDSVKNSLAIWQGQVIGVTVTGGVFALNLSNGELIWEHQLGDASERWIFHAPLVARDTVYCGSNACFAAIDAATGRLRWERSDLAHSDWISSYVSPTLADGVLVVGFLWGRTSLCGLDPDTGATLWIHEGSNTDSAVSTPVASGDRLWVMRHSGVLQSLRARTGETIWEFPTGSRWSPAAAVIDDERIYAASGKGTLHALDRTTGEALWSWQSPPQIVDMAPYARGGSALLAPPLRRGDHLFVPSLDGHIHIIRCQTGEEVGRWDAGFPLASGPIPYGKAILQADTGGRIHALLPSP